MPTSVHDDTEFVRHVYARLSTFIHRLQAAFNGEALLEIRGHTSLRKQLKILRVLRKSDSQERVATVDWYIARGRIAIVPWRIRLIISNLEMPEYDTMCPFRERIRPHLIRGNRWFPM